MRYEIVVLKPEHIDHLLSGNDSPFLPEARQSWTHPGCPAYCLTADGVPVMAGGIVDLHWHRGEAWMFGAEFFRSHLKTCLTAIREILPFMATTYKFRRVQATCAKGLSEVLFEHLGFKYEGTMQKFGPGGEDSSLYSRIFEVTP